MNVQQEVFWEFGFSYTAWTRTASDSESQLQAHRRGSPLGGAEIPILSSDALTPRSTHRAPSTRSENTAMHPEERRDLDGRRGNYRFLMEHSKPFAFLTRAMADSGHRQYCCPLVTSPARTLVVAEISGLSE